MHTFAFGVLVPAALAACGFVALEYWIALLAYVVVVSYSETFKRICRAHYVPHARCGAPPVVVGGGWSWVIGRRRTPANTIYCASGHANDEWRHAGTAIGDVQRILALRNETLAGHPSILSATLGGWVMTRSHGTGGSLWTPTIGRVLVEEANTQVRRVLDSKDVVADMIIRQVELHTVVNATCEQRVAYLNGEDDVRARLIGTPTYLRAVFVDRFQALCITWVPAHGPPAPRRLAPPLWLMTTLPARFRRGWDPSRWTRRMTLREANAFSPAPPFILATACIATHTNFEVFITEPTTAALIWRICTEFQKMFSRTGFAGRMELRFGKQKQFLDFDLLRWTPTAEVFHTIRRVYGTNVRMHIHPGKAQVPIAAHNPSRNEQP